MRNATLTWGSIVAAAVAAAGTGCSSGTSSSSTGRAQPAAAPTQPTTATTSSTPAASTTTPVLDPNDPDALQVTKTSAAPRGAVVSFSQEVDPASISEGVAAFQDDDRNPGGSFHPLPGSWTLDPDGRALRFRSQDPLDDRQVRLQLGQGLQTPDGSPLLGGAGSAAISFPGTLRRPVYEARFTPPSTAAQGGIASNTPDDHGDDAASATAINPGPNYGGRTEDGFDSDWFRVQLLQGRYTLRSFGADTVMSVYSYDGRTQIAVNDDDPNGGTGSRVVLNSPGQTTVFIEVWVTTAPANYTLRVEGASADPGDSLSTATPIPLDRPFTGAIEQVEDLDWLTVDLQAGRTYEITTSNDQVPLHVLDPNNRVLAGQTHTVARGEWMSRIASRYSVTTAGISRLSGVSDPNRIEVGQTLLIPTGSSTQRFRTTSAGAHKLALSSNSTAAPPYTVVVRDLTTTAPSPTPQPIPATDEYGDTPSAATRINAGQTVRGKIHTRDDRDFFAVELRAGFAYRFIATGDTDITVHLYATNGRTHLGGVLANGGAAVLERTATTSGTHYVAVIGYEGSQPTYTFETVAQQAPTNNTPDGFAVHPGTDPWHVDFQLRASTFANDVRNHGLQSGNAALDSLVRRQLTGMILAHVSEKYKRNPDGRPKPGISWSISFVSDAPSGTPGRDYSRMAIGGVNAESRTTLGRAFVDYGNRRKEDNSRPNELGVFTGAINGRNSSLSPRLTASDLRYVNGSYQLGDGSQANDTRYLRIRYVLNDWSHAIACVLAHEVGHSVGLDHDESDELGIMQASISNFVLSNAGARFDRNSAAILDQNLGHD